MHPAHWGGHCIDTGRRMRHLKTQRPSRSIWPWEKCQGSKVKMHGTAWRFVTKLPGYMPKKISWLLSSAQTQRVRSHNSSGPAKIPKMIPNFERNKEQGTVGGTKKKGKKKQTHKKTQHTKWKSFQQNKLEIYQNSKVPALWYRLQDHHPIHRLSMGFFQANDIMVSNENSTWHHGEEKTTHVALLVMSLVCFRLR